MKKILTLAAAIPLMVGSASAITVDEIIFQNGAGLDSSQLAPVVSMSLSGSDLIITMQNLTPDAAGGGALVLFTGLAFDLPTGIGVSGGNVTDAGPTTLDWTTPDNAWGYDHNAAGLSGGALAYATLSPYDTRVSTIASDGKHSFADYATNAGGMDYGIFSAAESSTSPSPWVKDTLEITLNLTGLDNYTGDLLAAIEGGRVAAIFGSPNGTPSVPDGGLTLALLGAGVASLGLLRRRA